MAKRLQSAAPRRASWHKLSDRAQCAIARLLRTMSVDRAARSLNVGEATLDKLVDGGSVTLDVVMRLEAALSR